MEEKVSVNLDPEAQRLFDQFAGLETWQPVGGGGPSAQDLAQSLLEEQRRHDRVRIALVRLLSLLRYYLTRDSFSGNDANEVKVFQEIAKTVTILGRTAGHLGFILVRFRGTSTDPAIPSKYDYEAFIGNTMVDNLIAPRVAQRCGQRAADLPTHLLQACTALAEYGVSNLYISVPDQGPIDFSGIRLCLKILSGFRSARDKGTPINIQGNKFQLGIPLIQDENMFPDPNLTLLAGINRISAAAMETLVNKVDLWLRKQTHASKEKKYAGVYNAALDLPKLSLRLKRPLLELNNVKWLLCETEEEEVSLDMAQLAKLVMETSRSSPQKAAKIIQSVYGKDYAKISTPILGERLNFSTDLLYDIENRPQQSHLKKEVLGNLQLRLDQVKDQIIDEIVVREDKGKGQAAESAEAAKGQAVHSQIYEMVSFFKGRSNTHKKMTGMVHHAIEFTDRDYLILSKDFRITLEEAKVLVGKLKACFQSDGRFIKTAFSTAAPHFRQYEQKIFQFLWHHMKDVIGPQDRVAFLNALQSLTSQMEQPKRAMKILLEDISSGPQTIKFSDDKAVMLANLIVQRDKSLTDYEITPEDIVLNRHAIDSVVAEYAAWRIEKDHDDFLTKVQTVHNQLCDSLALEKPDTNRFPIATLLNIERELYIFLSLVACNVGRAVLKSAVNEYGNPASAIFHQKQSSNFIGGLLQNLRVALRGLGSVGGHDDIGHLERVKTQEETFLRLKNDRQFRSQARMISEWVDEAVKFIKFRA